MAVLALVMVLLVSGRVRLDLVGLIALALVGVFRLVPPRDLFSGFSSYAAVILAEMMVLGEGLRCSGATEGMTRWFERLARAGESPLLTALMLLPAIPSTFVSDVGLMSMILPTMLRIRQRLGLSLHRLLMPLAMSIALGGLLSMVGSSGNIIANSALAAAHHAPVPLFGIAPLGAALVLAGFCFMKLWGVARLPAGDAEGECGGHPRRAGGPPAAEAEGPEPASPLRARGAAATVLAAVAVAAAGWLPVQVAAAAAVAVLVLARILSLDQAYGAIDWRIICLVGGVTPLSVALVRSGVTADLSRALVDALGAAGPYAVLAAFFWLAAGLTQVVSNVAAALVLAPLAVSVATSNGWSPDGLVIALVVALSAAPITPLANKVYLMTIGPGRYGYRDYLRIGTPFTVVMFVLTVIITPLLFPFRP